MCLQVFLTHHSLTVAGHNAFDHAKQEQHETMKVEMQQAVKTVRVRDGVINRFKKLTAMAGQALQVARPTRTHARTHSLTRTTHTTHPMSHRRSLVQAVLTCSRPR